MVDVAREEQELDSTAHVPKCGRSFSYSRDRSFVRCHYCALSGPLGPARLGETRPKIDMESAAQIMVVSRTYKDVLIVPESIALESQLSGHIRVRT